MSPGLKHPAWAWGLAGLYVMLGAASFADDRFLHDEGLLTHLFSLLVERDFWPAFFLQKIRPPIAVLYAPAAAVGLDAFLWMHLCVSALAVPLVAATAHRLGHAMPNVPAAVVALSPMFVAGGAAGLSNADAVVAVSLVLWLWGAQRELVAGLALGVAVWIRAELLVLVMVMLAWAAWHKRPRAVLGLLIWPVLYGLAGAAYHDYLPWLLHYPPALSEPMPDNVYWQPHHRAASLASLAGTAVALSPAAVALLLCRPRSLRGVERWWAGFAVAFAGALILLPRWQVFNFDQSPRYLMPLLPVLALAVGRAVEGWGDLRRAQIFLLVGAAAISVAVHRGGGGFALSWATLGVSVAAAVAGAGHARAAALTLLVLLGIGPRHLGDGARIGRRTQAAALDEMVDRISDATGEGARPVVTNEPILAAYLSRSGLMPEVAVHYIVQADQVHELKALTNPANGQRERVFAALAQGMYGTPIFPDQLSPEHLPSRALLVLTDDRRLKIVMPPAIWGPALDTVSKSPRLTVAERKRERP